MVLFHYGQRVGENTTLKNDNNIIGANVTANERQKRNSATGSVLLALSSISIASSSGDYNDPRR